MKLYYSERNNLLQENLELDLDDLLKYFKSTYRYFKEKQYFVAAEKGVYVEEKKGNPNKQMVPPSFCPSPEVYFSLKLRSKEIWPIESNIRDYDETTLFSVIEIMYDHIGKFDIVSNSIQHKKCREEYAEQINNFLRFYKGGYYLEPTNGFVMKIPNEALKEQLKYNGDDLPSDVYEKLITSMQMYYKFDANYEMKKKAINILADILEQEREELKDILHQEYGVPKKAHDKLIFDIVNNFNIRHNNDRQKTDYSKDIWYDWMMQYYTSVIIAYYKLKTFCNEI